MVPGYVKLHRQLIDWEWYQDANTMRLFIHCLIKANYEEKKWKGITIEAGSFATSSMTLADELHLTRAQIRRSIYNLQSTQEIATKTTNKITIIKVLNWAKYQETETTKTTSKKATKEPATQPTNSQQTTTTKEIKNKRIKEVIPIKGVSQPTPTLEQVITFCKENKFLMDPEKFFNYQKSKGWKVGTAPMKDWQAACRNWEKREQQYIEERKNAGLPKGQKPDVSIDWLENYIEQQQS